LPATNLRSISGFVAIIGLLYFAILFTVLTLQSVGSTGTIEFFELLYLPFVLVAYVAIILVLRRPRLGYAVASAVSLAVVLITGFAPKPNDLIDVLANPASTGEFFSRITFYPALFAVFIYSILGFLQLSRQASTAGQAPSRPSNDPASLRSSSWGSF
jgi:hypothetical protein